MYRVKKLSVFMENKIMEKTHGMTKINLLNVIGKCFFKCINIVHNFFNV